MTSGDTILHSFASELNAVVIGAGGGIGRALVTQLATDSKVKSVHAFSRQPEQSSSKISTHKIDILTESSVERAVVRASVDDAIDIVLVATGILHQGDQIQPERTWRSINALSFHEVLNINAVAPALLAKHFLPALRNDQKSVFAALSARIGSIEDNRGGGWVAYRSSKAALNMIIRTLSIELMRRKPNSFCVALHPGTVDTQLSLPFQANVPKLFTPQVCAKQLLTVIDRLQAGDSGGFYAWDGQAIPF